MTPVPFAEAADRVKSSLDIVDIIQRHVVLKKSGRNYKGVCPFHGDKSPSLDVNREKGVFLCRSCGVGGGALNFIMRIENKTYGEIIRELAQEQGIEIERQGYNPEIAAVQQDTRQKILSLNDAASRWFSERLRDESSQPVMRYLESRYTETNEKSVALSQFQLGYAPEGWENLTAFLKSKFDFVQSNPELLTTAGLSNTREHGQGHYDRFRHRLIIPIQDEKGQVVAFGGRSLSDKDKPKYLNSPETVVYKKSNVLYGFYQAHETIRKNRSAVVMEGYFDVITAHLAGVTEAVGSCGTAMTDRQWKLLSRFGAETVYLAFDSDEAGIKAALNAISLMEPYLQDGDELALRLKVLIVPDGKDPDEFIRHHGGASFRELMANACHYLDFKFNMALRGIPLNTSEGRIQAANRLTPILAGLRNATTRAEYLRLYSEKIGTSEEALHLEVKRYEQSRNPLYRKPFGTPQKSGGGFQKSGNKKAISKQGSTSLGRSNFPVVENLSDLRSQLNSRHIAAEKNLLKLALYNTESFILMMRFMNADTAFSFDDTNHQEILSGFRQIFQASGSDAPALFPASPITESSNPPIDGVSQKTNLSDNGLLGTLIEKMNHLYCEKHEILHTFAELVLTAESFCDSLGLGELQGVTFESKISHLAQQQVDLLNRCRRDRQLQEIRTQANQSDGDPVELIYQFNERFLSAPTYSQQEQAGGSI